MDTSKTMFFAKRKKPFLNGEKFKKWLFYVLMLALPLLQFAIFYWYVNFDAIAISFKSYDNSTGVAIETFVGWKNFLDILKSFRNEPDLQACLRNSGIFLAIDLFVIIPLSLVFSYYIVERYPFANFFKIALFVPSVICSMVLVIFYNGFVDQGLVWLALQNGQNVGSFMNDLKFGWVFICFFYVWINISFSILLYINALSGVSKSLIEASRMDGAGPGRVFFHVYLPGAYKTIVSFTVISLAGYVANQAFLYSFFGNYCPAEFETLGYYQYKLVASSSMSDYSNLPFASALGLICTTVITPLVFLVRGLLNRFGPREE